METLSGFNSLKEIDNWLEKQGRIWLDEATFVVHSCEEAIDFYTKKLTLKVVEDNFDQVLLKNYRKALDETYSKAIDNVDAMSNSAGREVILRQDPIHAQMTRLKFVELSEDEAFNRLNLEESSRSIHMVLLTGDLKRDYAVLRKRINFDAVQKENGIIRMAVFHDCFGIKWRIIHFPNLEVPIYMTLTKKTEQEKKDEEKKDEKKTDQQKTDPNQSSDAGPA